jgi:signal transduction histidine kinase
VSGDEQALDKIACILLENAIKYSLDGKTIKLRTYQKDGHGFLEVQDEGIGIKASELPHIFDRFYRADSSRSKTHVAGHGLGLAIAQKLVEKMDGKITATSTPGKGSTFTVRIPLATS